MSDDLGQCEVLRGDRGTRKGSVPLTIRIGAIVLSGLAACSGPQDGPASPEAVDVERSAITTGTTKRINCGPSGAVAPFAADTNSAGTTLTTGNSITLVPAGVPQAVYKSMRSGNLSYTIGGFTPGFKNKVRLHFAEIDPAVSPTTPRRFNVAINGQVVLAGLDVYSTVNGRFKAYVYQTDMLPRPGTSDYLIQLTSQTAKLGMISGIEVIVPEPCADGTAPQAFGGDMFGCPGGVTFDQRATLCGPGYHVASASEWTAWMGGQTPANNYWTDTSLRFITASPNCIAADKMAGGIWSSLGPPRVCVPGGTDQKGNTCDPAQNCGLDATGPGFFFGMSPPGTATPKAGALCVRSVCKNGDAVESFGGGMIGCPGATTYANKGSLCGDGYHVASAEEWVANRVGAPAGHDYWTWDNLSFAGSASGQCAATFTPPLQPGNCPGTPMRVCTPSGLDSDGNNCNWTNCGLTSNSPNNFFGGCGGNTNAGALCIHSYDDACPATRCPAQCATSTQSCNQTLWPRVPANGPVVIVYFEIVDPSLRNAFLAGRDAWNAKLSPTILLWESNTASPRLKVKAATSCGPDGGACSAASVIGNTGDQSLYISANTGPEGVAHEIGHAFGLLHEHVRGDRDRHVQVVMTYLGCDSITGDNWHKCGVDDTNSGLGAYDQFSTMHYVPNAPGGAIWRRDTMTPASGGMGLPTDKDASKVLEMYASQLGWHKSLSLSQDVGSHLPLRPYIPSPPASLPQVRPQGRPAVASQSATAPLDLFVRGEDSHIYYTARTGVVGTYQDLGGNFTSDPAAASAGTGNLFVVAAQSGVLKVRKFNNGWGGTTWQSLPAPSPAMASGTSPAAVMWGTNVLNVFIRTSIGIMFTQQTNGTWGPWELVNPGMPAGVTLVGSPAVASQGVGEFNIYVNSSTGTIWSMWRGASFGWQNGWTNEVCCADANTSPSATSWAGGRVDLFYRQNKQLRWRYATNQWFGPYNLGGLIDPTSNTLFPASPAATARGTNRVDVVSMGTDDGLWLRSFTKP